MIPALRLSEEQLRPTLAYIEEHREKIADDMASATLKCFPEIRIESQVALYDLARHAALHRLDHLLFDVNLCESTDGGARIWHTIGPAQEATTRPINVTVPVAVNMPQQPQFDIEPERDPKTGVAVRFRRVPREA